jgi:ribosomal protein S1
MDFKALKLNVIDKDLTPEERDEWNAIYASYRSGSVITGQVVGVDRHTFTGKNAETGEPEKRELRCLIVIQYRVKIIIPETEVWAECPEDNHIMRSMCGATIDYVVSHIDREGDFAVASRKMALERRRHVFDKQTSIVGKTVDVRVVAVGKGVCTVECDGYDVLLAQRDISYSVVKDLRETISPGDVKRAVVKAFNPKSGVLELSVKDTMPNPFDGADIRHPIGSTRLASIIGKYAGGVFCRLYDNVTDVLCKYDALHYDGDFQEGDTVEIVIQVLNFERKLVYGKIIRKLH